MNIVTNNSIRSNYLSFDHIDKGRYVHAFDGSSSQNKEYNFHSYSPTLARWIQEDQIQEQGEIKLYNFVNNTPITNWDVLKLDKAKQIEYSEYAIYKKEKKRLNLTKQLSKKALKEFYSFIESLLVAQSCKCCFLKEYQK